MAKTAFPDASRMSIFRMRPEDLTIVTDPKHPLCQPVKNALPVHRPLVESIKKYGYEKVVLIMKDGPNALIIDGRQGVKAARQANIELVAEGQQPVTVPVWQRQGDIKKLVGIMAISNRHSQANDPVSEAREVIHYIDDLGVPMDEVLVAFGLKASRISQMRQLLNCDEKVLKAVAQGMSITAAVQLSHLPRAEQVKKLDEVQATEGKPTVAKVARSVKPTPTNSAPGKKQLKRVFEARKGSKVGHVLEFVLTGTCSDAETLAELTVLPAAPVESGAEDAAPAKTEPAEAQAAS